MHSKVIFLDVDGTLVGPLGKVSDKVKEAIVKARENGHYVFICTGRNHAGIRDFMSIGFDGVICSAGGYIEVNHKKIYESFLSEEDFQEAREIFTRYGMLFHCEATHKTFTDEALATEIFTKTIQKDHSNSEIQRLIQEHKERHQICDLKEYDKNPIPIHKICFIAQNKEDVDAIKQQLGYKYNIIIHEMFSTEHINGEIIIKGTDKGKGVQKVVQALGLDMRDTICFGDSMNDLEMVKACQISVVMENGSQELKKYATTICESVQDDGIYHELKRLGCI